MLVTTEKSFFERGRDSLVELRTHRAMEIFSPKRTRLRRGDPSSLRKKTNNFKSRSLSAEKKAEINKRLAGMDPVMREQVLSMLKGR